MRCSSRTRAVCHASVALASMALLAGCVGGVTDPKGPIGAANLTLLVDSLAIMLAIVVPTILATLGFAWWFRASNRKAHYRPDWEFSGSIELVVWAIPLLTILLLGGVTWIGSHSLDPAKPIEGKGAALEVQVVSLDWKWLFIYPEQRVASINELVVPAGRPLHFTLTSSSVMNAFFVPQLGSMIYTMNGMATQLWLHADEPGTFLGMSAHYSGEGFSDMRFDVKAVTHEQFAAWVNKTRDNPARLDREKYAALAKQSLKDPVAAFGSVDIGLFDRVVSGELAAGPGPGTEDRGAHQAPESEHKKGH
ncbi:MAG TPA: ubiquinol oxidase subunit II [Burkholderiaceae bacterium]|nr:ubiquinol oxidase subunit II [Burkholderiaceae bacterium]